MLGRQQIADVSTAINELFKNAHDAYADNVEVDFFRSDKLLVIRDDGIGMTKNEFENHWLVLGTESKLDSDAHDKSFRPKGKEKREIMGEKGIGRLAIALLGSQVLILTRSMRETESDSLTMCFIHWELFEIPSINLEDLDFPITTVSGGVIPGYDSVNSLLKQNLSKVKELAKRYPDVSFGPIVSDIEDFQLDPEDLDGFLGGLSLNEKRHGTHFYIAPANDELKAEIEQERESRTKEFSKNLLGFCNSIFGIDSPPPIETAFRYWPSDRSYEDMIGPGEFFSTHDLNCADQHVVGEVNEFGQFIGNIRVYEQEYQKHLISWNKGGGKKTACGPFNIEFGYLQPLQRETKAEPEDFHRLRAKLEHISGLYVYRDGIRILPYGNSDVDWLDIEVRRTKGAGYYYFSYRNIYGAVNLTRTGNKQLKEKAGREGFQKDKAYRQLKDILENIFIQLATDFFRKEGDFSDYFYDRKAELSRLEKARKKREKQVGTKRKKLAKALEHFFQNTYQKIPEAEIDSLRRQVHARMEAASKLENPDEAAEELLDAENDANRKLTQIRISYQISKPRGVGLTKTLQRDWDAYLRELQRLEEELFLPLSKEVAASLGKMAEEARIYIDQRRRLKELIKQVADNRESEVKSEAGMLEKTAGDTRRIAIDTARKAIQEFRSIVKKVEIDFAEQDLTDISPQKAEEIREQYELRIEDIGQRNTESLGRIREMLTNISENLIQSSDIGHLDMVEAMDQELQGLREQADTDSELVQLGLAVAVINHEFEAAIKGIRTRLRELGTWANANDELLLLYQEIRTNFDHLDAHLNLFTPLQRRLQRKRTEIKGSLISQYLKTLFSVRFNRNNIELAVTEDFIDSEYSGFPSVIYPVFVNIIDNAVFWLQEVQSDRLITLDYRENCYLISNSGPSVHSRDQEAIFEQGFSRKPGGRGLGLFISKKTLNKEGMDLEIEPSNSPSGATFKITWAGSKHD